MQLNRGLPQGPTLHSMHRQLCFFAFPTQGIIHLPEGGSEVVFTTCDVTAMLVPAAAAS